MSNLRLDDAPQLPSPAVVLLEVACEAIASGEPREAVFLNAGNPRHRWARRSFPGVDQEFEAKTVWVAKQVRQWLGPPRHDAYVALPERISQFRCAAWWLGDVVGYVSLVALRGSRRPRLRVVVGAVRREPPHAPSAHASFARGVARLVARLSLKQAASKAP